MASTLVSVYVGSLQLGYTIETNSIKFQIVDPETCTILIFFKLRLTSLSSRFLTLPKKSREKFKYVKNKKRLFFKKKKHFPSFLKGFDLPEVA